MSTPLEISEEETKNFLDKWKKHIPSYLRDEFEDDVEFLSDELYAAGLVSPAP